MLALSKSHGFLYHHGALASSRLVLALDGVVRVRCLPRAR